MLQVHPRNITAAIGRRIGPSDIHQFAVLERAKRPGLTEYMKGVVKAWWHNQTRVSLNKKDITRRRVGRKDYIVHATHFLTKM